MCIESVGKGGVASVFRAYFGSISYVVYLDTEGRSGWPGAKKKTLNWAKHRGILVE